MLQASATVAIVVVNTINGRMDDLMDLIGMVNGTLCSLILHVPYVHTGILAEKPEKPEKLTMAEGYFVFRRSPAEIFRPATSPRNFPKKSKARKKVKKFAISSEKKSKTRGNFEFISREP